MGWGGFGTGALGGAHYSDNYSPYTYKKLGREIDPALRAAIERARDFAADTNYNIPGNKKVVHVMDPFGGGVRQLIVDRPDYTGEIMQQNRHLDNMDMQLWQLLRGRRP